MNTPVLPPVPVNPVISIQPVTSAAPERDTAAPNLLANLAPGTTVEGFVVNRDVNNNPILRTALGDLRIGSQVFLKTGSEVVFRVDTTRASLARIVSVDGLSLEEYNALSTSKILTVDTVNQGLTSSLLQTSRTGPSNLFSQKTETPILQALILQTNAQKSGGLASAFTPVQQQSFALTALYAGLRPGTPLKISVLDVKLPALPISLNTFANADDKIDSLLPKLPLAQSAPTPSPASVTVPTIASPIAAVPTTIERATLPDALTLSPQTASSTQSPPAIAREVVNPGYAAYSKPSAPYPTTPTTPPPNVTEQRLAIPVIDKPITVQADVIGHDAEGANILHTPFASLKLYTPQPLPTGTSLLIEATADTAPPSTPNLHATQNTGLSANLQITWGSLEETITTLRNMNEAVANNALQYTPIPNHRLLYGFVQSIAAIKAGDIESIVGKRSSRLLETVSPALLQRLQQELSQAQTSFVGANQQPWVLYTLPMFVQGSVEPVRLYISGESEQREEATTTEERGQRFIFEVGLSALGAMQFDGFIRQHLHGKQFDLVVRSQADLPAAMSQDIRVLFEESQQISGIRGQIVFQAGMGTFFRPPSSAADTFYRPTGDGNTILA